MQNFSQFLVIKTLVPHSLKMLDPDSKNQQHWILGQEHLENCSSMLRSLLLISTSMKIIMVPDLLAE
jgi:hypothetical protein